MARLLLERGARVEAGWKPSEDRCTLSPLQLAVATGNIEMVSLLLAHGANACLSTLDKVNKIKFISLYNSMINIIVKKRDSRSKTMNFLLRKSVLFS